MSKKVMTLTYSLDRALIRSKSEEAMKKGIHKALDHLAAESKKQVPLDQGTLRDSCYVDVNEKGTEGTVSYDTKYAVRQHEELSYNHQRGRKAKYLEDPCNDTTIQTNMMQLIASEGKKVM